jgi:hypothetical protein
MERPYAAPFATEIEFTLPKGFIDETGALHRSGVMRLATGADEILPQRDPRVQANPAYFIIIVLARVITRLGSLPEVDTRVVESLFAADLEHLRRLYEQVNAAEDSEPALAVPQSMNGYAAPAGGLVPLGEA